MRFRVLACVLAIPAISAAARAQCSAAFNFADLSAGDAQSAISLVGDAHFTDNDDAVAVIRLTPNLNGQAGAAWYTTSRANLTRGFYTVFRFQIPDGSADGFAFVVQNEGATAIGDGGSGMGYGWNGNHGITSSLAVEFDTFSFPGEFDADHVSIQTQGLGENSTDDTASLGHSTIPFGIADGAVHTVKITCDGTTMNVYVDDLDNALLTTDVDLTNLNGDNILDDNGCAWVGFTAGTGGATASQDILSWEFNDAATCTTVTFDGFGGVFNATVGQRVEQSMTIGGTGPKAYQWKVNGVELEDGPRISGAHTDHIVVDPITAAESGHWDLDCQNDCSGLGVGWDLHVCGNADFNGDGDLGTDLDIQAFFACLGGSCCATCQSADFNGDGDLGTDSDIEAFFRVLAGGGC